MDAKVSRRELERVIEDVSRAREGLLWRREMEAEDIKALLAAARVLLDMQPASDEEILEVTMPALWMSTRPPKYDVAAELDQFAINCYRDAEDRLLSKVDD